MTPQEKYLELKKKIMDLGIVIPGTVRKVTLRCGNAGCHCRESKKNRHGPYLFWDRKKKGRLSSMSIPETCREQFQKWIGNRRVLEALVRKMLALGLQMASKKAKTDSRKVANSRAAD